MVTECVCVSFFLVARMVHGQHRRERTRGETVPASSLWAELESVTAEGRLWAEPDSVTAPRRVLCPSGNALHHISFCYRWRMR